MRRSRSRGSCTDRTHREVVAHKEKICRRDVVVSEQLWRWLGIEWLLAPHNEHRRAHGVVDVGVAGRVGRPTDLDQRVVGVERPYAISWQELLDVLVHVLGICSPERVDG